MHRTNAKHKLALLRAIEASAAVQATMTLLGEALLRLLSSIALDSSLLQGASVHAHGGCAIGSFSAAQYDRALLMLVQRATTANAQDSGSVQPCHVLEALAKGNVRERCTIFMNIIFKDTQALALHWILYRSVRYSPFFLNMCVVHEYRARVCEAEHQCMHVYRNRLQRRQPCEHQRLIRTREEREKRRLHCEKAVPSLSKRERAVAKVHDNRLSWLTGHMKWSLNTVPPALQHAYENSNDVLCGVSGHTDLLLTFAPLFACYDLRVFTLIAVLWLVGSDHHSMCEVLFAARAHGLAYDGEDALEFVQHLLSSVARAQPVQAGAC